MGRLILFQEVLHVHAFLLNHFLLFICGSEGRKGGRRNETRDMKMEEEEVTRERRREVENEGRGKVEGEGRKEGVT